MAQGGPYLFLWDNQQGFINPKSCVIEATDRNPFRVSQYFGKGIKPTESLRNLNGVQQSHLVNFSVVKKIAGPEKRKYERVQVAGVNNMPTTDESRWQSKRGDSGYLFTESLRPMEDFAFKVNLEAEKVGNWLKPKTASDRVNAYVRIASDSSYYKANCEGSDRDYFVFRGYGDGDTTDPMFYLGVSEMETGLFEAIVTYPKMEAKSFIAEIGEEEPLSVSLQSKIDATEVTTIEDEVVSEENAIEDKSIQKKQLEETLAPEKSIRPVESPLVSEEKAESLQQVVCIGSRSLNVRNVELDQVLFKAHLGEHIKIFQSWDGESVKEKIIGGVTYQFKKVEFSDREEDDEKVGYVADSFIKNRTDCPFLEEGRLKLNEGTQITGLDDGKCCYFPTVAKPTHRFTSGMRRFSAGRSGGRLHAACDLYRYKNEPAKAVAAGRVVRDMYYFYQGTYAIEVKHQGGFIVRYGELTSKGASTRTRGVRLNMSDRVGYIGKVNSGCCNPMLHFELYDGSKNGALSTGTGRYQRRSDLLNPTDYLLKWESMAF